MSNRPCDKNKKDKVLGKINLLQFVLHAAAPPAPQMCSDRLGDIFVLPWASPSAVDVLAFHRGLGLSRNAISCVSEAHGSKSLHPHHHHHYHHPSFSNSPKDGEEEKVETNTNYYWSVFLRDNTSRLHVQYTSPHPRVHCSAEPLGEQITYASTLGGCFFVCASGQRCHSRLFELSRGSRAKARH